MNKISLQHVSLNAGGYDSTGLYWGAGDARTGFKLYRYGNDDWGWHMTRADNREDAKAVIRRKHPLQSFSFYNK